MTQGDIVKKAITLGVMLAAFTVAASGCGADNPPTATESTPAVADSSSPTSSSPTPSSTGQTEADLKKTLLTTAELGKAWEASSGGSGPVPVAPDACPQPERGTNTLEATGRTWQGFRSVAGGMTIALTGRSGPDAADYKTAYIADLKKCKNVTMKSGGNSFILMDRVEGPQQVSGCEEVIGSSVRRYFLDTKGKPLAQVIQSLVCRKGSVIVEIGYSPYTKTSGQTAKRGKDFAATSKLMQKQLKKIVA
jgi:hypothetical protein